jgi:hypothetical protein
VVRKELTDAGFRVPDVLTFTETLRVISEGSRSLARFGDGERTLMLDRQDIPFQKWSPQIAAELKRVASNADGRPCDIGVNRAYLYRTGAEQAQVERFYAEYELPQMLADRFPDYLTAAGPYLDATFTIPYHHFREDAFLPGFFAAYFDAFAEAFKGRDVILAAGKGVINEWAGMSHDLLRHSASVETLHLPDMDAYFAIDEIEHAIKAMNPKGSRLVALSCGPTATVLAYRLSDKMRALDIGHAMRECDRVARGVPPDDHGEFFAS